MRAHTTVAELGLLAALLGPACEQKPDVLSDRFDPGEIECFRVIAHGSINAPPVPLVRGIDAEAPKYFGLTDAVIPGRPALRFLAVPQPGQGAPAAVGYWQERGDSLLIKWHRNTTTHTMAGVLVRDTLTGVEGGRRTELGGTIAGAFKAVREACSRRMFVPRHQTERWLQRAARSHGV